VARIRVPSLSRAAPRAALALAIVAVASCLENGSGPAIPHPAYFAVVPSFQTSPGRLISLAQARITLQRAGEDALVIDSLVPIQPGDTAVDLSASVNVLNSGEEFILNIYLITSGGSAAFRGGPVTVTPSLDASQPTVVGVEIRYVGVGSDAAGIRIISDAASIFSGDSVMLMAEAFDTAGTAIPGTPIGWGSLDPLTASIPRDSVGLVLGESQRGTARITATLLTGQSDTTTVDVQPVPSQIAVVSGGSQTAEVGAALPSPIVLEVQGADGLAVTGVSVALATSDGSVVPDSAGVDANGRMTFSWTLGPTAGTQTVTAGVVEYPSVQLAVTATATPKVATTLTIVSGDGQTGVAAAVLPESLVVLATDVDGQPVPNTTVAWTVTINAGSTTPTSSATDASGLAATAWTLGSLAGANEVTAAIPGDTVTFTATGVAGAAAAIQPVSGDAQSDTVGATLPQPLVVRVTDGSGNPVAGVTVDFATPDGGSLAPTSTATDTAGLAQSAWTLGPTAGTQSATATSTGLAGSPLTFTASATLPSRTNTWTGTAGDGLWTTAGNWSLGYEPDVADTVAIGLAETVSLNADRTVQRVQITDPGATLTVGAAGNVTLTVAAGFTNAGTIVLTNTGVNASAALTVTSGTLVNTGTIEATYGVGGGGGRSITGAIDNQGTLSASSFNLTVVNSGQTFMTTNGTLATPNGNTLTLSGGTVQFGAGTTLSGAGVFSLPAGTVLELPSNFTLAAGDYRLDLAGASGITINGPGTFTAGDTLVLTGDTINAPLSITGQVEARGTGTQVNGALAITPTGVLRVGDPGNSGITVASGFTNAGSIVLTNDGVNASATLTVTSGSLINTGTITSAPNVPGAPATMTLGASLDHRGTISLSYPLNVSGQLIVPSGASPTTAGSGSALRVAGLDVVGGVFDNAPLVSTGGTIIRFDSVTFQNMAVDAIQLTVNHPGAVTPFVFTGVAFPVTPTTGFYVQANDTDTGDGNALTINMADGTPADGSAFESELNGAVINWTSAQAAGNSWTGGAGDGLWSSVGNWSLGRTPDITDTVYITLDGTYTVTLNVNDTVSAIEVGGATGTQTLSITNRTLTVDSSATFGPNAELSLAGGTITGGGDVTIDGAMNWTGGTLSTTGTTTIGTTATATLSSTAVRYLYNGTLVNAGAVVWSDGTIYSYSGGSIDNQAGGTFEVQGARSFTLQVAGGTFTNAGTLSKTGTGTAYFTVPYSNTTTGVLDLQTDTLRFTSTFDHQSGATLQGTGALNVSSATPTFAGDIEPGAAGVPGMLTIIGDLTLQSSSNLNVDIDGYTLGTQYDQLAGVFTPAGTLTLNLDAAFVPNISTVFDIMTYSSITGDFTTTNGEGAPFGIGDRVLSAAPGATTYVVTVVAFP